MSDKYDIAFNTNFVASLTGASVSQLNMWDKRGLSSPSVLKSSGRGSVRLYSFKDIVEVKTIVYLRDNNISLKNIKMAIDYLKHTFDYKSPLSELVLISNGKDVLCAPQGEINDISARWIAANKNGQLVMRFMVPLGAITQTIDAAIKKYNERIEEASQEEANDELVSLKDIEESVFGVSSKVYKKRA
ncbi:MAG: MerR family transcriptional regulator [Candidatus Gastranaerophilales bacterium]|nr:MerR family transcriptional regulator [Candidatus Gastranaerophilales bacterium]